MCYCFKIGITLWLLAFGAGILLVVCFVIVVKYLFNGLKEFLKI